MFDQIQGPSKSPKFPADGPGPMLFSQKIYKKFENFDNFVENEQAEKIYSSKFLVTSPNSHFYKYICKTP